MTPQAPNFFLYKGILYNVRHRSTEDFIFNPRRDLGVKTFSPSTNCHRGYITIFSLLENHLILDSLCLQPENPIKINGIDPLHERDEFFKSDFDIECVSEYFDYYYRNLNLKIDYTGSIIIGLGNVPTVVQFYKFAREGPNYISLEGAKESFEEILNEQNLQDEALLMSQVETYEQFMELLNDLEDKIKTGKIQLKFLNGNLVSELPLSVKEYNASKLYSIQVGKRLK